MNIVIVVAHIAAFALIACYQWKITFSARRVLMAMALLLKLVCGLAMGWLYSVYYPTGDTFQYFADATVLADIARADPMAYMDFLWSYDGTEANEALNFSEPRALFFDKFVSIVNLATFDNYWLTACWFSLVSFFGAWVLCERVSSYLPKHYGGAYVAFCFFPSIVFWTSGLIKESIAMASLFFLTSVFFDLWFSGKTTFPKVILSLLSLWILWSLKYYYAAIFIPVVITTLTYKFLLSRWLGEEKPVRHVLSWMMVFALFLVIASFSHPNFHPHAFIEVIVSNHNAYRDYSAPEDMVDFGHLTPQPFELVSKVPLALVSGLFRPFVFEAGNAAQMVAACENLLLVILFMLSIGNVAAVVSSPHRILLLAGFIHVLLLCIFITLSTPNFGTLSRYRVGYLPFFVFILLCDSALTMRVQSLWHRFVK